uniref:Uncharacterized protein n=1 Tax=Caenorhabditis japonica TaxID=281687 RepID=A0A8R1IM57_CAEJA
MLKSESVVLLSLGHLHSIFGSVPAAWRVLSTPAIGLSEKVSIPSDEGWNARRIRHGRSLEFPVRRLTIIFTTGKYWLSDDQQISLSFETSRKLKLDCGRKIVTTDQGFGVLKPLLFKRGANDEEQISIHVNGVFSLALVDTGGFYGCQ